MLRGVRGDLRGSLRVVLGEADALQQSANFFAGVLDVQMVERQLYGRDLVVGVENLEIAGQSEALGFATQQPRGKGMKCSHPGIVVGLAPAHQQVAQAFLHLRRGLVGEGHGENGIAGTPWSIRCAMR